MQKPRIDDKLTLLVDSRKAEAICAEVLDDPGREGGVLLKVMSRGPFRQGQQCCQSLSAKPCERERRSDRDDESVARRIGRIGFALRRATGIAPGSGLL